MEYGVAGYALSRTNQGSLGYVVLALEPGAGLGPDASRGRVDDPGQELQVAVRRARDASPLVNREVGAEAGCDRAQRELVDLPFVVERAP